MDAVAVERARGRLERAERAFADFKSAAGYAEAEDAWTDFLLACSTIYSQLEQGAKTSGKSAAWFGRQKALRKAQPVLRYLHFARNADEHGIERVTAQHPGGNVYSPELPFGERREWIIHIVDPVTMEKLDEGTPAWAYGPHLKLVRAYDRRFGDFCDPPPNLDPFADPTVTAEAGLVLLRLVIEEAAALIGG